MLRRILAVLIPLVLVGLIVWGYYQPWTGFGPSIQADGSLGPSKTLWDWLDLLLVPLLLAVAAWWLDGSRKRSELRVEADRQQQSTLDAYFASMTELLMQEAFSSNKAGISRSVARSRTLAALRSLDGGRKAQLLQFLYEAGLIDQNPVIELNGADLSGADLDEAVLRDAELRGVHFSRASFKNATLSGADLRGSDFSKADFSGARLDGSNLVQANLKDANVCEAALASALTDQAILPAHRS